MSDHFDDESQDSEKSKTQIKQEMHALQDLGGELVKLTVGQLHKVPLDQQLLIEINKAQQIKKFGALKRQLQYIGKLLRNTEVDDIREALARIKSPGIEENQRFHRLEKLREQLLNDGDTGLNQLFEIFPVADRQHIRQLVRQAIKERNEEKPPTHSRKLFRYLRELDENQTD